jgi:hypothetical protein
MARVKATLLRRRFAALTRAIRSRSWLLSERRRRARRTPCAGSAATFLGWMFYADCNHVVILHGRMTTSWQLGGSGRSTHAQWFSLLLCRRNEHGRPPVHTEAARAAETIRGVPPVESTTRLGDWYGNIVRIGARQHLLFISERSRLPVIVPLREAKRLSTVFPEAVCDRLAVAGVTTANIAKERAQMSEMVFGRTRNRRLLGTLNDFAFMAQIGERATDRTRVARGADAVPLRDPDPSVGRRKPDRPDASCVCILISIRLPILGCIAPVVDCPEAPRARQDFPPPLRGLDPPARSLRSGNYRERRSNPQTFYRANRSNDGARTSANSKSDRCATMSPGDGRAGSSARPHPNPDVENVEAHSRWQRVPP